MLFAVLSRLIPHAPNFNPVISVALFAGAYLEKRFAFAIAITMLFVSDLFLGFYGMEMFFVYGSLLFIVALGAIMNGNFSLNNLIGISAASAIVFFTITNFGVWLLPNSAYPKTLAGLGECYEMGIPFFRNTLLGILVYNAALFGIYELAIKPALDARSA
jgi:hypothetical protein